MAIFSPPFPNKNYLKFLLLFILFGQFTFSQAVNDYKKYIDQYPNSQVVRLNQQTVLKIGFDKEQFKISKESLEEDIYLNESAKYDAKQSLSYSTFYELDELEASSFVNINEKYEEIKVSEFKEKDELDGSFYDDVKSVNFIFPSLGKGAKTKLKYKQTIKNPRFLNAFYFGSFYPIEESSFTIIADKSISLRFQEFNMEGIPVEFSQKSTRRNNIYTWQIKNVDEYKYEKRSPDYKNFLPHIIPIIVSYDDNGKTIKLLENVSDLYKWYYSLVGELNKEAASPELVRLVDELTTDKENELEKVRAIYYWVQENVKYIAFEYALGGFIPREANEVFQKKYGDCKDNSSLLLSMLKIAGIDGSLTWIGTRSIPYSYEDVPTPAVDNHMILNYEFKGETYYLDATGRFNPLEIPPSFIQGKEALVSIDQETFMIKKVPVIDPSNNLFSDYARLELDNNTLVGKARSELSGYGKIDLLYRLEKKDTKTKLIEFYNTVLQKGDNSFQITNFEENNKYDYDNNLIIDHDFNIPNYAKTLGDEIFINLNLDRTISSNLKIDKNRVAAIEHKYKDTIVHEFVLMIPEGYEVDYLPKGIEFSSRYFDTSISYEVKEDEIIYKQRFRLNTLLFEAQDFKAINDLVKKVDDQYKEVVVLKAK